MKDFLGIAEAIIKVGGFAVFGYIILVGLAHRAGYKLGEAIFEERRRKEGKPVFKSLLVDEKRPPFWKDEKLIHGGVTGAKSLMILSLFVIVMLVMFAPTTQKEWIQAVTISMAYPNGMAAVAAVTLTITLKRDGLGLWPWVFFSVLAGGGTWFIIRLPAVGGARPLVWQAAIFVIQSLIVSYIFAVGSGVRGENTKKDLPMVDVVTGEGEFQGLRLLQSTESNYHFLQSDDSEWLIPRDQIWVIKLTAAATESGERQPPDRDGSSTPERN